MTLTETWCKTMTNLMTLTETLCRMMTLTEHIHDDDEVNDIHRNIVQDLSWFHVFSIVIVYLF